MMKIIEMYQVGDSERVVAISIRKMIREVIIEGLEKHSKFGG